MIFILAWSCAKEKLNITFHTLVTAGCETANGKIRYDIYNEDSLDAKKPLE